MPDPKIIPFRTLKLQQFRRRFRMRKAGQITALVEAMRSNSAYVNVHTTASPGGEIRGQIFGWGR